MTTKTEHIDGATIITIDPGRTVTCDVCNGDWTDRAESGGLFSCGWVICPDCAPEFEKRAAEYDEDGNIRKCPLSVSFADWVREVLR